MGDLYWIGEATAVAQVTTITVTAYDAASVYKLTVGAVTVSATAAGDVNATAAALQAAWAASTHPYLKAVTATVNAATVTLTAGTAGVPFTVTSSVAGGAGTIGAATTTAASAGPNHWDTAANWSTGVVPANGDNVYLRNNAVPVLFGLAQSGIAPAMLIIEQTYTGTIGLPYNQFTTAAGAVDTSVPEYRSSYLQISPTILRIGENYSSSSAAGSSLIKIDTAAAAATIEAFSSGTSTDDLPPIRLRTDNAAAVLKVYGAAAVGLAYESPGETSTIGEIDVYPSSGGSEPAAYIGPGVTQQTHRMTAGSTVMRNAPTNVYTEYGSNLTLAGNGGTITLLQPRGALTVTGSYTITSLAG